MALALSKDPQVELERCALSKLYFATHYYWARTEKNTFEPLGKLWEAQVATLKAIDEFGWVYNLKARKLGISTIGCVIDVHNIVFRPHCRVHLFSKRDEDAVNLLDRCKAAYHKLPSWMRAAKVLTDNTHTLVLDYGDGDIRTLQAYSSDPDAGRSESCQHAHVDEFAIIETNQQEDFWAAVEPSIVPGGTMHMMTTGKGSQNYAAQLWKMAMNGQSRIKPIFLAFDTRPDRDLEWYREKARMTSLRRMKQEYPRVWSEALIDPEKAVFPDEIREKNYVFEDNLESGILGHTYIQSWDLGYKVDAAALTVVDVTEIPYKTVNMQLYEHVPYSALQQFANEYNKKFAGLVYVESNAMGEGFIQNLDFTALPHNTGPKTKPEGLTRLQLLLEQGLWKYNPREYPGDIFDDQLASYTWEDINLVQDLVMSASIAAYHAYERMNFGLGGEGQSYESPGKAQERDLVLSYNDARADKQSIVRDYYRERSQYSNDEW